MAMELSHTWGGEPNSTHHSSNVSADTTNPGRAYNVTTRSYLATNRSVMKYSFVTSPPWDDTLTLLEPADYSYDRCAFGGTVPTDGSCTGLGTTTGTTLGVPAGTVKSRLHRATQHLATRLDHLRPDHLRGDGTEDHR